MEFFTFLGVVAVAQIVQVGVGVKAVLCHLDLRNCHVAAMVAYTLVVGQQIVQHKTVLNRAAAGLQAGNVPRLDGAHQLVDHGLQRLHLGSKVQIPLAEGIGGAAQGVLHRILQHLQLLLCILGEVNLLLVHLLGGFQKVDGMVADALKITDGVQQGVHALAVGVVQFPAGQLDQISAQCVLVPVHPALLVPHLLGKFVVPFVGQAHGLHNAHPGKLGHFSGSGASTLHSHGGGVQQTVIQQRKLLFFRGIGNGQDGQLFQPGGKGQQNDGGQNVEHRVHDCNAPSLDGGIHKGKVADGVESIESEQEDAYTDNVEVQVHHGSPAGVLIRTHRGQQCGHTGTDVLTHDDGDGTAVGDDAGGAQCLQDAHAGAGALDDAGDQCAHQNAQQGVGEAGEQAGEPCLILQRQHRVGHGGHAGHQHSKADEDGAHALFLLTLTHIQQNANKCKHRAKRSGLEQLDEQAVALQAGKTQDPAGHGSAHVAAHDHANGLMQLHDAAVDKAYHHNRGSAGALDYGGHAQTQKKALEGVIGQLAENFLQLAAGLLFQCLAHDVHTEQKQGQTSQQRKDIKNGHKCFPHFS